MREGKITRYVSDLCRGKHELMITTKCQLAPFPDTFDANDPVDTALLELSEKLKTNFLQSAYSHQFPDADYDFSL